MGDPAGIGPEIVVKSLESLESFGFPIRIYCSFSVLQNLGFSRFDAFKNVKFLDVYSDCNVPFGAVSLESGKAQLSYLQAVVNDIKKELLWGVVTLPINKEAIKLAGFKFPGHTEFFASEFGVSDFAMMLANSKLKVVLETIHVPLKEVPGLISTDSILKKILLVHRYFPNERIAIAGLNPHAGENGLFGDEEARIITPAVERARQMGIDVEGPFPSDTVFNRAVSGEFGIVVCMYHDQGLIPVKLTGFSEAVNITLGLPFVRTSVGHGTAYDIVGKGVADIRSFLSAVNFAVRLKIRLSV
ncbi:4-hydroxythreonine-4-phosphate dehydrogenase PdxA [Desulfurobacterium indicum]|uniref:4-hydroxythreonine-4-phosphate dehydrogenase PdxA n=1 Tax=Desulfurobacterium indicum TaxID=1914305 RepID=A0A1R1MJ93_9BACT|nr:4-hydroxythreonine-4-phosphate dehydrogenase PdxA [Desulfurobacterium indicum]OMH39885.1 4-hydroxythreonine-4-phosphate dehydrogenase PdxA [Desulfurobacterium indicum]